MDLQFLRKCGTRMWLISAKLQLTEFVTMYFLTQVMSMARELGMVRWLEDLGVIRMLLEKHISRHRKAMLI